MIDINESWMFGEKVRGGGGNMERVFREEGDGCTVVWSKVLTGVGLNMGYGL